MVYTVDDGFKTVLGWISPSEVETTKASAHRASIEACLKSNFGMTSFFRAGSFGHGTSVSGYSDVDYFSVVPAANLNANSSTTLTQFKTALAQRFPNTGVYVDSPAVVVPFGTGASEKHEITPAYLIDSTKAYKIYGIPNRAGGWMVSSPTGLNAYTNVQNDRLNKRAKHLVRLIKLWNYQCQAGIRSVYIEMRVAEYLSGETSILYHMDVHRALKHLQNKGLAAMQDPLGLSGYIYPCTDAVKPTALSRLSTAVTRAEKAYLSGSAGKVQGAVEWWGKLFNGYFPNYG